MLPLRRFRLSEEEVMRPIPTLSDRQFVVAKAHLSSTDEFTQRELFWYREELFKRVRGKWKEVRLHVYSVTHAHSGSDWRFTIWRFVVAPAKIQSINAEGTAS